MIVSADELERLIEAAVRRALADAADASTAAACDWIDTSGAADLLGVNRRTIMKIARAGKLSGGRIGKLWRFRRADVESLLDTSAKGAR